MKRHAGKETTQENHNWRKGRTAAAGERKKPVFLHLEVKNNTPEGGKKIFPYFFLQDGKKGQVPAWGRD